MNPRYWKEHEHSPQSSDNYSARIISPVCVCVCVCVCASVRACVFACVCVCSPQPCLVEWAARALIEHIALKKEQLLVFKQPRERETLCVCVKEREKDKERVLW